MEIFLKNTLTGRKDLFEPITPGKVNMYNCGPTVYNFVHIGNLRSYVFADSLRRMFEYFDYEVKQVVNITDVGHLVGDGDSGEDKVAESAKKEGKSAEEISRFYEESFFRDLERVNAETSGTLFPRATEHIAEQIEIIKLLEEKGFAYQASDGIYFDTAKFPDYGKLGNINIAGLREGARVEASSEKKNPTDFALWKFSKGESRLQEWTSPWGTGFPGWHVECSAMSHKYLGQPFDIHTGGIDHIPVHHNNEIAQSEAAYDLPLSHYWLHNEFLTVDGQKMSKSLSNTYTLSDLRERKVHPLSFRYWLLGARYSSPMNFTWEAVEGAQNALEKLLSSYPTLSRGVLDTGVIGKFEEAIADDLNTPVAIALLQEAKSREEVENMDRVLGLNIKKLSEEIQEIPPEIEDLKKQRDQAREEEDWKKSDELRDVIESRGFRVKDAPEGALVQNTLSNLV